MARSNADKVAREYYEYKRRKEQQRLMREAKPGVPTGRAVSDALEDSKIEEHKRPSHLARTVAEAIKKSEIKPVELPEDEPQDTRPEGVEAADLPKPAEDLPDRSAESEAFQWDIDGEADEPGEDDVDEDDGNTVVKALQLAKAGALVVGAGIGKGITWLSASTRNALAGIRERRVKDENEQDADQPQSPDDDIYTYQYTPNRSLIGAEDPSIPEEDIAVSGPLQEDDHPADLPPPLDLPPLWREEEAQDLRPGDSNADWMEEDEPEPPVKPRAAARPKRGMFSFFSRDKQNDAEDGDELAESNAQDAYQEGIGVMDKERKTATTMTDLLAEDLGETPVLSRRERRALAEAQEGKKPEPSLPQMPDSLSSDDFQVDEPTVEFTPIRARRQQEAMQEMPAPAKLKRPAAKPVVEYDDDDDEDDEDEEEQPVRRPAPKEQPPKPPKRRVYDDEDDDYDDEDDDYDDDDDDDDDRDSFGKRLLGFLKGLIVIGLILLLAVLALRLTEANGAISLNGLRSTVGGVIPYVNTLFPEPSIHPVATVAPIVSAQPDSTADVSGAADAGAVTEDTSDASDAA